MPKQRESSKSEAAVRVEVVPITDLQQDDQNANVGTLRGTQLLHTSLEKLGAGRSVLLDRNGKLIGGNKAQEAAVDLGFEEAIVVHTDGRRIVAVMRDDLDLDEDEDGRARALAVADNRVAEVNLQWDAKALQRLQQTQPAAVGDFFFAEEVDALVRAAESAEEKVKVDHTDNTDFPDLSDPSQFWPEVKVRISPDAYSRYEELQARVEGESEGLRLAYILEVAETALNAEEGDL